MAAGKSVVHTGDKPFKLIKWKITSGSRVSVGTGILLYELLENGKTVSGSKQNRHKKFKASVDGTVEELIAKEGSVVNPGDALLLLKMCTHPIVMRDFCADCGADLREWNGDNQDKFSAASVSMIHSIPELRVNYEQARQLGQADAERLLRTRKLALLVDLDQTLIHTTSESVPANLKDVYHFQLYGAHSSWYHTRIRPGTSHFLEQASKYYELHICTFGARPYAHMIASLLDPDKKYFASRILSRDECFNPTSKTGNLRALFPCGDSMVCIIDDREDVWNFASNLVPVKPYIFFSNTGDINAPCGIAVPEDASMPPVSTPKFTVEPILPVPESKEDDAEEEQNGSDKTDSAPEEKSDTNEKINGDAPDIAKEEDKNDTNNEEATSEIDDIIEVEDEDDYLLYLEEILTTIHRAFYDIYDQYRAQNSNEVPDLKNVVPYVKRKVLKGVNILFSGVIPTNQAPEKCKIWQVARSLGAVISTSLSSKVTHVVAARLGTAKVAQALKYQHIHVINPGWLWCCADRWEHAEEKCFPLTKDIFSPAKQHSNTKMFNQMVAPDQIFEEPSMQTQANTSAEPKDDSCPVYDPVTGKRIRKDNPPMMRTEVEKPANNAEDTKGMNENINPHLSMSSDELKAMDREVEDACSEASGEGSDSSNSSNESEVKKKVKFSSESETSNESLTGGECPKGWHKRKRDQMKHQDEDTTEFYDIEGKKDTFGGEYESEDDSVLPKFPRRELPYDSDRSETDRKSSDEFDESVGSVDEEMAAAVEREFLGL